MLHSWSGIKTEHNFPRDQWNQEVARVPPFSVMSCGYSNQDGGEVTRYLCSYNIISKDGSQITCFTPF